jgi:hypothetical protein
MKTSPAYPRDIESWGLVAAGAWLLCAPVSLDAIGTRLAWVDMVVGAILVIAVLSLPPCPSHWRNTPYVLLAGVPPVAMMLLPAASGSMLLANLVGMAAIVVFGMRPARPSARVPATPIGVRSARLRHEAVSPQHGSTAAPGSSARLFESSVAGVAPH